MNGYHIPGTPIAVDYWKNSQARMFFLSHMHADHTSGLTPSWSWPIYCTEITKKLLIHKFQIRPQLIHALEVNQSHILFLDKGKEVTMTTTVLDANHCPGSAMFLFEGYFGRILYTGDFRYGPSMFVDSAISFSKEIDVLYLDNSFCSPRCQFPSRTQAFEEIAQIITAHVHHSVVIGVRTLGKEELLVALARHFQTWIGVSPNHYRTLEILGMPNVFTTEIGRTWIQAVPLMKITRQRMEEMNKLEPTIAILPTAMYSGLDAQPFCNDPNVFIVPYSDHSSYQELHLFVGKVRPKQIVPIVKGNARGVFGTCLKNRADLRCFTKYLSHTPVKKYEVPSPVRNSFTSTNTKPVAGNKCKRRPLKLPKMKRTQSRGVVFESPEKMENVRQDQVRKELPVLRVVLVDCQKYKESMKHEGTLDTKIRDSAVKGGARKDSSDHTKTSCTNSLQKKLKKRVVDLVYFEQNKIKGDSGTAKECQQESPKSQCGEKGQSDVLIIEDSPPKIHNNDLNQQGPEETRLSDDSFEQNFPLDEGIKVRLDSHCQEVAQTSLVITPPSALERATCEINQADFATSRSSVSRNLGAGLFESHLNCSPPATSLTSGVTEVRDKLENFCREQESWKRQQVGKSAERRVVNPGMKWKVPSVRWKNYRHIRRAFQRHRQCTSVIPLKHK